MHTHIRTDIHTQIEPQDKTAADRKEPESNGVGWPGVSSIWQEHVLFLRFSILWRYHVIVFDLQVPFLVSGWHSDALGSVEASQLWGIFMLQHDRYTLY